MIKSEELGALGQWPDTQSRSSRPEKRAVEMKTMVGFGIGLW